MWLINSQLALLFCGVLLYSVHYVLCDAQSGVVFSPLVRKADKPSTTFYTRDIIKVMLDVLLDAGYGSITTYGVGGPNIHTALAAAELNKEKAHLRLTVYQGLYSSNDDYQVNSEIKSGLDTAQQANKIFNGTVQAIIYPSVITFAEIIGNENLSTKMKKVSEQARAINLKFGLRIPDCRDIPSKYKPTVADIVEHCDFIICLALPEKSDFRLEFGAFKISTTQMFLQVGEYFKSFVNSDNSSIELFLETGWPGDAELKPPNSIQDLISYWTAISDWGSENGQNIFHHEAYDSPWKEEHPEWALANHFGRWEYNEKELNMMSKDAYILKKAPGALSFLGTFGITQIGILLGIVLVVGIVTTLSILYRRVMRIEGQTATNLLLSEHDLKMFFEGGYSNENEDYKGDVWDNSPYNNGLECDKNRIKIDKSESGLLGSGQFGFVYKGEILLSNYSKPVAVKMTKPICPRLEVMCLLSEIKILTYLGTNRHICNILGAYTKEISKGVVYFAMELCSDGNLEKFLRSNRVKFEEDLQDSSNNGNLSYSIDTDFKMTQQQLIRWAIEIASAMEFISSKNVIHSDLAARNVLLTEHYFAKVTDFGLSRRFFEEEPTYAKSGSEPLPWKWLAPESLEYKTFSTKSDVWAYGVTLWEIFSIGSVPRYPEASSWNNLLSYLNSGNRLEKPVYAADSIYQIMADCWILKPQCRPSFSEIRELLNAMTTSDYVDLTE